jgi:hypothetical protein
MKKTNSIILILFFCSLPLFAQVKIIADLGYQNPEGDISYYDAGIGLSGGIEYYIQDSNTAICADISYNKFSSVAIMTLTGGVKGFIKSADSKIYPYFGAKLGSMYLSGPRFGTIFNSSLVWVLEAGLRFQIPPGSTSIDFNIKYNTGARRGYTVSFIGINAGLAFTF